MRSGYVKALSILAAAVGALRRLPLEGAIRVAIPTTIVTVALGSNWSPSVRSVAQPLWRLSLVALCALAVAWAALHPAGPRRLWDGVRAPAHAAAAAFAAVAAASTLWSTDPRLTLERTFSFGLVLLAAGALGLGSGRDPAVVERLLLSVLAGAVVVALAGLVVLAVVVLPFVAVAPGGVWRSVHDQAARPLQVESLAASLLETFGDPRIETSHGSQNVAGHHGLGVLFAALQAAALVALWVAFARGPVERGRFVRYAAACVGAFVAFGKVLSPQFLVWLVPLVPLVRGRRGVLATALLATALVLTQVWFPRRYWDYVNHGELAGFVLARDLVLVVLVLVLAVNMRMREIHSSR
jgi:hypothetical protein